MISTATVQTAMAATPSVKRLKVRDSPVVLLPLFIWVSSSVCGPTEFARPMETTLGVLGHEFDVARRSGIVTHAHSSAAAGARHCGFVTHAHFQPGPVSRGRRGPHQCAGSRL